MRLSQIVIDSADPRALSRFWSALLGGEPHDRARGWSHVDAPGFPRLAFQPVPEPRAGKNRLHLDVAVADVPAGVARALELGATAAGPLTSDDQGAYRTLRDPEGNEFCLVCP
ncbi:VOC family protein [Streptomyces sp. NRRL S-87]|uniref:VOC family protein n=1 Tax=Streptomyces sp. NRRL S-87 TaxID=1463920 RepID=UPI0004C00CA3|nr:VOC family protein [Streptomyces sp. NRRL S-87]